MEAKFQDTPGDRGEKALSLTAAPCHEGCWRHIYSSEVIKVRLNAGNGIAKRKHAMRNSEMMHHQKLREEF